MNGHRHLRRQVLLHLVFHRPLIVLDTIQMSDEIQISWWDQLWLQVQVLGNFIVAFLLSIWSWGFLLLITWLLITQAVFIAYEYTRYRKMTKPPVALAVGQMASIFGYMVGRAIICDDHNHFEPYCHQPRDMWCDIKTWIGLGPSE